MTVKFYQVGGSVRDELLGVKSKDIDYAVEASSYDEMREQILAKGGKIFVETPKYFTIRATIPSIGPADFTLCRKDGVYKDGRHPENVEIGSILDDLARRDFTMNAIAISEDGLLLDPYNGEKDIHDKIIHCVGEAKERFTEDALRLLRAFRFSITKNFSLCCEIKECLCNEKLVNTLALLPLDRIREELRKAFKHNTRKAMEFFANFPVLMKATFKDPSLWLEPTTKE